MFARTWGWDRLPACRLSQSLTGWKPIPQVHLPVAASRATAVLSRWRSTLPHDGERSAATSGDVSGGGAHELLDGRALALGTGGGFVAADEFLELLPALAALKIEHRHGDLSEGVRTSVATFARTWAARTRVEHGIDFRKSPKTSQVCWASSVQRTDVRRDGWKALQMTEIRGDHLDYSYLPCLDRSVFSDMSRQFVDHSVTSWFLPVL